MFNLGGELGVWYWVSGLRFTRKFPVPSFRELEIPSAIKRTRYFER